MSAISVVCDCRPSAFVCLEHWQHICECKPSKHCLLDRHTLAELSDLLLTVDKYNGEETQRSKVLQQRSFSSETSSSAKKVKGGHATLAHLADQWLLQSTDALKNPFSKDIYQKLLKEGTYHGKEVSRRAEVGRRCKKLPRKIENHSLGSTNALERADLEYVTELLSFDTMPCNEPGHLKLKEYAEEAKKLAGEIESTLLSSSKLLELENLYDRSCRLGILVKGSEKLAQKISSMEEWLNRVRICLSEKRAAAIEINSLYKLKSEVLAAVIKANASREHEILAEIRDAVFTFICKMESKRVMDTMLSHVSGYCIFGLCSLDHQSCSLSR
ncbi:lysine-specific demethylase 5A [Eucalyptus grandis]|uniref:lysine-specific demethylase 5A n=1 Tax=Eucalyptus grandis TaxID=71139 RepID=UPI00192EDE17|nr:lysine-specific demethylase 5A [Eucalyptus grandis]